MRTCRCPLSNHLFIVWVPTRRIRHVSVNFLKQRDRLLLPTLQAPPNVLATARFQETVLAVRTEHVRLVLGLVLALVTSDFGASFVRMSAPAKMAAYAMLSLVCAIALAVLISVAPLARPIVRSVLTPAVGASLILANASVRMDTTEKIVQDHMAAEVPVPVRPL